MAVNDRENPWLVPERTPAVPRGQVCPPLTLESPPAQARLTDAPLEVRGHALPGYQVLAMLDGRERYQTEADQSGRFSLRIDSPLSVGPHELAMYQTDARGLPPTTTSLQFWVTLASDAPHASATALGDAAGDLADDALDVAPMAEVDDAVVAAPIADSDDAADAKADVVTDAAPIAEADVAQEVASIAEPEDPPTATSKNEAAAEPNVVAVAEPNVEAQDAPIVAPIAESVAASDAVVDTDPRAACDADPQACRSLPDAPDAVVELEPLDIPSAAYSPTVEAIADASVEAPAAVVDDRADASTEAPATAVADLADVSTEAPATLLAAPDGSTALIEALAPEPTRFGPRLTLQAVATGPHFRSLALTLSAAFSGNHLLVHTVFLPAGSPPLTSRQVVAFADADALSNKGAARAVFPVFGDERGAPLVRTLRGREGVRAFPKETGLIDGIRYDVYAVGVTPEGAFTPLSSACMGTLAMPFSGGNGTSGAPYLVRQLTEGELRDAPDLRKGHPLNRAGITEGARMLDNIMGMRALHARTRGAHGLPDTLNACYRLTTNLDLSPYAEAFDGRGWRPIGDAEHPFTGVLESIQPTIAIEGLTLRSDAEDCPGALGLVGVMRGGTLRTLWLDRPHIAATTAPGRQSYIGGLAGMASGTLENLRVTRGWFGGGCGDARGCAWIGGIVGAALDGTVLRGAQMSDSVLEAEPMGNAALGGLAGLMAATDGGAVSLSNCTVDRVNLLGTEPIGGAVAVLQATGGTLSIDHVTVRAELYGDARMGGLAGKADGQRGLLRISDCSVSGVLVGDEEVGGLIGAGAGLRCAACACSAQVSAEQRAGGLFGTLRDSELLQCLRKGSTTATDTEAGGLIAVARDVRCTRCAAEGKVVATGGVAGGLIAYLTGSRRSRCALEDAAHLGPLVQGREAAGAVCRISGNAKLLRCLSAGKISGRAVAAGVVGGSEGTGQVLSCAWLGEEAFALEDRPLGRIAAQPGQLRLRGNLALAGSVKIDGKRLAPLDAGMERSDGGSIPRESLAEALLGAGYRAEIWDLSNVAQGKPVLCDLPEALPAKRHSATRLAPDIEANPPQDIRPDDQAAQ